MKDLSTIRLESGGHHDRESGVCLMEAVAWVAGEKHSDHPTCVSPVLGAYGRRLNDRLPDDRRQELIPLIPELLNTAGDGHDTTRQYMAVDHAVRVAAPRWLDLAGMTAEAEQLRALAPIITMVDVQAARTLTGPIRNAAWARRRSVYSTVYDAVYADRRARVAGVAVAVAAVVAVAAADVAVAVAAAVADAAADVAAVAVAADVAVVADAADVAAAAAADVAADVAGSSLYDVAGSSLYDRVKAAVTAKLEEKYGPTIEQSRTDAIELFKRMIRCGQSNVDSPN